MTSKYMKNFFNDNNPLEDTEENATIMPIFTEIEGNPDMECSGVA